MVKRQQESLSRRTQWQSCAPTKFIRASCRDSLYITLISLSLFVFRRPSERASTTKHHHGQVHGKKVSSHLHVLADHVYFPGGNRGWLCDQLDGPSGGQFSYAQRCSSLSDCLPLC